MEGTLSQASTPVEKWDARVDRVRSKVTAALVSMPSEAEEDDGAYCGMEEALRWAIGYVQTAFL
jgi:hypothetical protein